MPDATLTPPEMLTLDVPSNTMADRPPSAKSPKPSDLVLEIAKSAFVGGLNLVRGAVASGKGLPITQSILIAREGAGLVRLTATNLDTTVTTTVPASIAGDGAGIEGEALPASRLIDFVQALPDGPVRVALAKGKKTRVKGGAASATLLGLPADEFPVSAGSTGAKTLLSMPASILLALAKPVYSLASTEESRPILNGVLVEIGAVDAASGTRTIHLVATNGHRLGESVARLRVTAEQGQHAGAERVIVPPIAFTLIEKAFAGDESITVATTGNLLTVTGARTSITTRLIAGPYPEISQVIPKSYTATVEADSNELIRTLRRVSVVADARTKAIVVTITAAQATITSQTPDLGDAQDSLPISTVTGSVGDDGMRIGFNAAYLVDLVELAGAPRVQLCLTTPLQAILLKSVHPKGESPTVALRFLVMPQRVAE